MLRITDVNWLVTGKCHVCYERTSRRSSREDERGGAQGLLQIMVEKTVMGKISIMTLIYIYIYMLFTHVINVNKLLFFKCKLHWQTHRPPSHDPPAPTFKHSAKGCEWPSSSTHFVLFAGEFPGYNLRHCFDIGGLKTS